jgi:hypothetical protein
VLKQISLQNAWESGRNKELGQGERRGAFHEGARI